MLNTLLTLIRDAGRFTLIDQKRISPDRHSVLVLQKKENQNER